MPRGETVLEQAERDELGLIRRVGLRHDREPPAALAG